MYVRGCAVDQWCGDLDPVCCTDDGLKDRECVGIDVDANTTVFAIHYARAMATAVRTGSQSAEPVGWLVVCFEQRKFCVIKVGNAVELIFSRTYPLSGFRGRPNHY